MVSPTAKTNSTEGSALQELREQLLRVSLETQSIAYALPRLWLSPHDSNGVSVLSNPASHYLSCVDEILSKQSPLSSASQWLSDASIYCVLPRHTTAFHHNQESGSALTDLHQGWRQTGSFLKLIAILPYLGTLGVNTVAMLPFMTPGLLHRKGDLGSIYAISDLTGIDPLLSEPCLNLSVERQCEAFIEAAHLCGMRVIAEFALRTSSRDAEWIVDHPEWYYWIRRSEETRDAFHPPHFDAEQLVEIRKKVDARDYTSLPAPASEYTSEFCTTPLSVTRHESGECIGTTSDGIECVVPGAFADYPPDDTQPLWTDVSYLRLYAHPDYDYVAYNTVRMYDDALAQPQNQNHELWNALTNVIPSFQTRFNIDGAVLDMSHALPDALRRSIIQAARAINPDFVFIEENFEISEASVELGFDAVVGDLWLQTQRQSDFSACVASRRNRPLPQRFFATPDTHNTPRAAFRYNTTQVVEMLSDCLNIPNGIPFLLSGTEFGEREPINTGLGFSPEEAAEYSPQTLPLFSACSMNWANADIEMINAVRESRR